LGCFNCEAARFFIGSKSFSRDANEECMSAIGPSRKWGFALHVDRPASETVCYAATVKTKAMSGAPSRLIQDLDVMGNLVP